MNPRVAAVMSTQFGLITRPQAVQAGMRIEQIDRLVRAGSWTTVRPGVYAETALVEALTDVRARRLLVDRAASLRISRPHVMSHHSAAYLLNLAVLHEYPNPFTHVTRPGLVGTHRRRGISHHLAPYRDDQLAEALAVPCLDAARTALDIARSCGAIPGLVAADSALRMGASTTDLARAAADMKNWPHKAVVDGVVACADGDADTALETLGRVLVESLGFGTPELQFGLTADGRTAWCDMRLGRHFFECDGLVKYLPVEEGGFASSSPSEVLWSEKGRQDFITGFKTGVSRIVWEDAWTVITGGPALRRVQQRLTREYLDTHRRFGSDIGDLSPYRPRGPRPRPQTDSGDLPFPFAA